MDNPTEHQRDLINMLGWMNLGGQPDTKRLRSWIGGPSVLPIWEEYKKYGPAPDLDMIDVYLGLPGVAEDINKRNFRYVGHFDALNRQEWYPMDHYAWFITQVVLNNHERYNTWFAMEEDSVLTYCFLAYKVLVRTVIL